MVEENFHKINSWRVDYINDLKLTFDAEKWFQLLVENWILLLSHLLRQIVSHKAFISYIFFYVCMEKYLVTKIVLTYCENKLF